jgi:hypothetical protein
MSAPDTDPLASIEWPKPPAPSAHCSESIRKRCTADMQARRGWSAKRRLWVSMLFSLTVFAVLAWLTRDRARHEGAFRDALIGAAGWGIIQATVLWVGLVRPAGRRAATRVRLVLAVVLPVVFLVYVGWAAPEWVAFSEFSHGARSSHAVGCGFVGLLFGAVASGGILLLWRGTDPFTPGLSGALAGLVGGVGGGLAIGIGCASEEGWHACFSHGLGVIAFVLLGWAVGRRLLAP